MSNQTHLIVGPPGTGKTTTLARWVERAVVRYGHEKVLVCSLTRAAAREAASRLDMPESHVGTLHRILYHAHGAPDIAEGHLKEWNESYKQWGIDEVHASVDDPYGRPLERATSGAAYLQALSRMRAQQVPRDAWVFGLRQFAEVWEDWKQQCGYWDFTDLLERGLDFDAAPQAPHVICVDEAQDFGRLEMSLISRWAAHCEHLVLAGDGHQNLYAFRGSDPHIMFQAGIEPHILQQSYRIPRAVHAVALRWMQRTGLPQVQYNARDVDGWVRTGVYAYDRVGHAVVEELEQHTAQGKTVMLMTTCSFMMAHITEILRAHGVPYHNPWRAHQGQWNPLNARKGSAYHERVLAFLRPAEEVWGEARRFWTGADVRQWAKELPAKGIFQRGKKVEIERTAADLPDTAVAQKLRDWFEPEALQHILTLDVRWYMRHLKGGDMTKACVQTLVARRGAAVLRETPRVVVGTVHSLKGSEADIVYVWPDISARALDHAQRAGGAELARVFYVAVTRAREGLTLMPGRSRLCVAW